MVGHAAFGLLALLSCMVHAPCRTEEQDCRRAGGGMMLRLHFMVEALDTPTAVNVACNVWLSPRHVQIERDAS